ncbi:hypothetical protein TeGR_g14525 [Tetraparma gracilis]|uniref:Leucine-rich repeat domain-containing protein n=1 Tax=Tetraparma gracilis TaxID=2962635 RepID=A0ABQ6N5I9_9STRA|nr:hypothetical protein TeGR_g14525 [Tetraparma gracilis]
MSKAVVYRGGVQEFQGDREVYHVTFADGVTDIERAAFYDCKGLTNLSFLEGSVITTFEQEAFVRSGIITLLGMEGVRKIGRWAFANCKDLRTIEGLACEEMGEGCFGGCTLLQSMKGWPPSMTAIPAYTFSACTGMTSIDCDLSHVTSIGANAFWNCTSLLPPSLSSRDADPAAVLAFLKRKSILERAPERCAFLCSLKHAHSNFYDRTGDPAMFDKYKFDPNS